MKLVTEKQLAFIEKLESERDLTLVWEEGMDESGPEARSTEARVSLAIFRDFIEVATTSIASEVIDYLLAAPRKQESKPDTPEGMHHTTEGIFKVQRAVHGSGHLYAKKLVERDGAWTFEYAPGAVKNLTAETLMTLEGAKAFGALYGTCAMCGRTLTDENSIAEGIGPVCAQKF